MNSTTKARQALERNRYNRSALTLKAKKCLSCNIVSLDWRKTKIVCKQRFHADGWECDPCHLRSCRFCEAVMPGAMAMSEQLTLPTPKPQVRPICNHCYQDWSEYHKCPISCGRWGAGEDKCIKDSDHIGPCEDIHGNTTLTRAAMWLGREK